MKFWYDSLKWCEMKIVSLTLIMISMIFIVCGDSEVDEPTYIHGQAISVVQTNIRSMLNNDCQRVLDLYFLTSTNSNFDHHNEVYLGNGIWEVKIIPNPISLTGNSIIWTFNVFESSNTASLINRSGSLGSCR